MVAHDDNGVEPRRIIAALRAVQGITTEALEADVIYDLARACEAVYRAAELYGGTGHREIDNAVTMAFVAYRKVSGVV